MTPFDKYLRRIIQQAGHEARKDGSATTEAQHLLLAIAAEQEPTTQQVLTSVGLDHRAIREALDREFEHSLSAAGVSLAALTSHRRAMPPSVRHWGHRSSSRLNEASHPLPARRLCSRRICCSGSCGLGSAPCRVPSPWQVSTRPT
jgi:ATP-dependent Clp protease ATP-binding subunit ClpA